MLGVCMLKPPVETVANAWQAALNQDSPMRRNPTRHASTNPK